MGINEEDQIEEKHDFAEIEDESSCEEYESDDSEDDPSFNIEKEVRYSLSRINKTQEEYSEEALEVVDIDVPELGEEDQKCYEAVQKKIEAGQLDKLKVDQCKVYLRKYGLRLSGNKETLIRRIEEHLEVLNGDGERKYPVSSFFLNCKGDACTGDVVLFEQNVYEMYSIASRSANGPPCGTRTIAGRIVKESYGAAKQQHTFTIEVLWSKGVKPLPPLHPLLIKGRNLYRVKTMRQKWGNEGERQNILFEKHSRGDLARSTRERRKEETKKKIKGNNREPKIGKPKTKKEENKVENSSSIYSGAPPRTEPTSSYPNITLARERIDQRQHLTSISFQNQNHVQSMKWVPLQTKNHGYVTIPVHSQRQFQRPQGHAVNICNNNANCNHIMDPSRRPLTNMNGIRQSRDPHPFHQRPNYIQNGNSFGNKSFEQKQVCVYYSQGRCYYGDRCKYLHERMENNTR